MIKLTGDADYVDIANNIANGSNYSISCWVRLDSITTSNIILGRGRDGSGSGWSISLHYQTATSKYRISTVQAVAGQQQYDLDSTTSPAASVWNQVGVTMTYGTSTADNILKIFVNGVQEGTLGGLKFDLRSSTVGLRLGRVNDTFGSPYLSDFSMFTRTLSSAEMAVLGQKIKYNPLTLSTANRHFFYPLDDFGDGIALSTTASGYKDRFGTNHGTGVDADGDSRNFAEQVLSYPDATMYWDGDSTSAVGGQIAYYRTLMGVGA